MKIVKYINVSEDTANIPIDQDKRITGYKFSKLRTECFYTICIDDISVRSEYGPKISRDYRSFGGNLLGSNITIRLSCELCENKTHCAKLTFYY